MSLSDEISSMSFGNILAIKEFIKELQKDTRYLNNGRNKVFVISEVNLKKLIGPKLVEVEK